MFVMVFTLYRRIRELDGWLLLCNMHHTYEDNFRITKLSTLIAFHRQDPAAVSKVAIRHALPGALRVPSEVMEKPAWWLIQHAKIAAVSPSLDATKEHNDHCEWLKVLHERLKNSRLPGLSGDWILPDPEYSLTLTFDDGSRRKIAVGLTPPNVITNACRVLIHGQERVVLSPGLPEYEGGF